ncbi:hypothetical protein [Lederbergia lenta]|uniref:hypothetical protein n=1 Tax=Lederbergia lenta TaxID=1467 RepID=UPI002041B5CB|nr:hypothetical protein [Lederbergia lenta]MCM3109967.1 hypothetical protein [Lederbergia lenta]
MSYIFEKQRIEKFEIEKVKKSFMNFRDFSNVRRDIANCELCDEKFQDIDNTNLAFVKKKSNMLICDECTTVVIQGGAEEVSW